MGKSGKETWNWTIMEEKRELIEGIVDGYRKLWYSEEKIEKVRADLLSDLQKEPWSEAERDELYWNKEKILENLKEKCVKVEKNVEYMWYKWKKVHINLPAVWKFKWFKFDYFVSDYKVWRNDFKPGLWKKLYTINDVSKLLEAMNKYMQAMGVETDWSMDYEERLKSWQRYSESKCKAWDCLKAITWLNDCYRLNHYPVMIGWYCYSSSCNLDRLDYYSSNYLFLKLSD
jgi:hypothetical protein